MVVIGPQDLVHLWGEFSLSRALPIGELLSLLIILEHQILPQRAYSMFSLYIRELAAFANLLKTIPLPD